MQLDLDERIEKLDETLRNVEEGYEILLKATMKRAAVKEAEEDKNGSAEEAKEKGGQDGDGTAPSASQRGKRKYVVLEDDEDEDEDEAEAEGEEAGSAQGTNGDAAEANGSSKKVKV